MTATRLRLPKPVADVPTQPQGQEQQSMSTPLRSSHPKEHGGVGVSPHIRRKGIGAGLWMSRPAGDAVQGQG